MEKFKFVVVDPREENAFVVSEEDLTDVETSQNIGPVDHGILARGIGYVCFEYAMYVPKEEQRYFTILGTRKLFAGTNIFYGYNILGHTIDLGDIREIGDIAWLPNYQVVEEMIATGVVLRPEIRVGKSLIWKWPDPQPEMLK